VDEEAGFRHTAPGQAEGTPPPAARGRERWVINKLRALGTWYTKGLEGGSQLRVAINSTQSIPELRSLIETFFLEHEPVGL
jgi:tRNA-dihydrouridine synthase